MRRQPRLRGSAVAGPRRPTRACARGGGADTWAFSMMFAKPRGFTLLELLLVMTIIGVLASVVVVNVATSGAHRQLQAEAERLALAVELARTEALRGNEIWGLAVSGREARFHRYDREGRSWDLTGDAYAFQRYVHAADAWLDVERRPFTRRATSEGVVFAARTTFNRAERAKQDPMRPAAVPGDDDDALPIAAIFPGGELTPFSILIAVDERDGDGWIVRSDGIERVQAMPANVAWAEDVERRTRRW